VLAAGTGASGAGSDATVCGMAAQFTNMQPLTSHDLDGGRAGSSGGAAAAAAGVTAEAAGAAEGQPAEDPAAAEGAGAAAQAKAREGEAGAEAEAASPPEEPEVCLYQSLTYSGFNVVPGLALQLTIGKRKSCSS